MREFGTDTQGMSEINKPWSARNKWRYQMMMDIMFKNSKMAYSLAKAAYDCNYQPGGNLLMIAGNGLGRAQELGSDKWQRFCWQSIRGEGMRAL